MTAEPQNRPFDTEHMRRLARRLFGSQQPEEEPTEPAPTSHQGEGGNPPSRPSGDEELRAFTADLFDRH